MFITFSDSETTLQVTIHLWLFFKNKKLMLLINILNKIKPTYISKNDSTPVATCIYVTSGGEKQ